MVYEEFKGYKKSRLHQQAWLKKLWRTFASPLPHPTASRACGSGISSLAPGITNPFYGLRASLPFSGTPLLVSHFLGAGLLSICPAQIHIVTALNCGGARPSILLHTSLRVILLKLLFCGHPPMASLSLTHPTMRSNLTPSLIALAYRLTVSLHRTPRVPESRDAHGQTLSSRVRGGILVRRLVATSCLPQR